MDGCSYWNCFPPVRREERQQFIRQKYVSLAFVPEIDDRSTHL